MTSSLGAAPGIMVGVGVGEAASVALEPVVEPGRQRGWSKNPNRILDPALVARLVAQGAMKLGDAQADARRDGFSEDRLNDLVYLAQTVPGFAEALALYRRHPESFADLWTHSLVKSGLDARYLPYLNELQDDRLSPPVVALAIVRGLMDAPFPLPFTPPAGVGKVPAFPKSNLNAESEARAFGFDLDRLFVQTAISGRPMGPEAAASAEFRHIIEHDDYLRAILEGDVRGEWADAILEHARQIPSVADYINAEIRGWISTTERNAGIARHGMVAEDGDLLYKRTGRPATSHQVHIGWARGGRNPGAGTTEREVFDKAIKESDIRPEWVDLLWAQRYTYPPFFAIRSLMQAGLYDQPRWEGILLEIGWPPFLAHDVSAHFTATTTTAENPYIGKAQTQLWNAIHKDYTKGAVTQADAESALTMLIDNPTDRAQVFLYWDEELALSKAAPPPA